MIFATILHTGGATVYTIKTAAFQLCMTYKREDYIPMWNKHFQEGFSSPWWFVFTMTISKTINSNHLHI